MARNPRVALPGYAYHVTQRGSNRQTVFRSVGDRKMFLGLMKEHMPDAGIRVLSYCLMTNHVHFVVVPEHNDSLSVWMRRVTGPYAQYFNVRTSRSGHLWQSRFFSCALSPHHLTSALRYVEQNPVRACLTEKPEDYLWSSARSHISGNLEAILDHDEWVFRGGSAGWADMIAVPPQQPVIHFLKRCTYGGRPFGDGDFVEEIERRSGQAWRRWPKHEELEHSLSPEDRTQSYVVSA